MRTIRGKLFISIGILLFLIAITNFFIPKFFIAKDMQLASKIILKKMDGLQEQEVPQFLEQLGKGLDNKISTMLFSTAFFGLIIALILLSRLSKKITAPIAQLAVASEQIGEGKYEGISLPRIEKRKDEVATFVHSFQNMAGALADREKVHGVLNKVVSPEIASEILQGKVELGGEERCVTLLFSDIRNFTALSNRLHPKEVIEMLNDYMTTLCQVVDKTGGVVDKFVGDEVIALYGAPLALENHADRAVEAALRMREALKAWNARRLSEKKFPLEMGVGLHTGVVCAGNMGASNRLNYTVIGSAVNFAARLCSAAKPMQILLSQATKEALTKERAMKALEPLVLKGFEKPQVVFELLS